MFRRRTDRPEPAWRQRVAAARSLIDGQRPPSWILERLSAFERALEAAHDDRDRLAAGLAHLDADRSARELKDALRRSDPSEGHRRLVASLRERYETIHRLHNRVDELEAAIDRALADIDVLAARSVALRAGDDEWRLDATVQQLDDDLLALERAHAELADL